MASTESIQVGSNALNLELLINRSNYKKWRLRIKTYLLSKDLWDVIEAIGAPLEDDHAGYKAWTKKNARALYTIQSSCGPEMFRFISETESAKTAWEGLEQECKVEGFNEYNHHHLTAYNSFMKHVDSGAWEKAKKCLGEVDVRSVVLLTRIGRGRVEETALHIAARIGHAHIVEDLVRLIKPEDCKIKTQISSHTALHLAAAEGHVHVVRHLPVDLIGEVQDNKGETALHKAVNAGKVDVVERLVNRMRREDLQIKNHADYTALHLAVNKGDMRVVKLLVRKTKGENKEDFERYRPFTNYVRNGDWDKANECLRDLEDPCRAIVAVDPNERTTALHVAATEGNLAVIKGLLSTLQKMRDHLELKTAEDFTTFGSRITLGVSEELLMEKAEYMVEQYESTPEGALEIQDSGKGSTPLHIAVRQGNMDMVKEIAHMMRQEGLEIRYRERRFWSLPDEYQSGSALHLAVMNGNIDIVKELVPLMFKEGFEIKDDDENTSLHNAVSKGNVDIVKELVHSMRPKGFNVKNNKGFNPLHLAVTKRHLHIVKELMLLMEPRDFQEKDHQDFTALGYAIALLTDGQAREIAKYIAEKDARISFGITSGPEDDIPVVQALRLNKWELACYLYKLTPLELLKGSAGSEFLCYCFDRKQFDMAWHLLHRYPYLAFEHSKDKTSPMLKLSRMSSAFRSGSQLTINQKWIYNCIPIAKVAQVNIHDDTSIDVAPSEDDHQNKRDLIFSVIHFFRRFLSKLCGIHKLYEMKQTHIKIFKILRCIAEATKNDNLTRDQFDTIKTSMFKAIQRGHFEFVTRICERNPDLFGKLLEDKSVKGIFHYAIESRQKEVYSLIYQIEEKQRHEIGISLINGDYTLLHYAANLSLLPESDHIHQDACLQMQREIQWFKEVAKVVPPEMYEHRDRSNDMTARELFTKNHKKLLEEAQIYIKGTASSCAGVVGALIVTIMFAAAFTVPGGNDDQTGFPQFLHHKLFKVYIVSDTISLVSATSSVITFLGILTSRYAENDFIRSLPTKIMFSLITLFFPIISMVIVFSCALILMFGGEAWVVMLSISLTSVPVILFIWLLFPLLIKTFMSTYGPGIDQKNT